MKSKVFAGVLVLVCIGGAAVAGWAIAEPARKPHAMSSIAVPRLHPRVVHRTVEKVQVIQVKRKAPRISSRDPAAAAPVVSTPDVRKSERSHEGREEGQVTGGRSGHEEERKESEGEEVDEHEFGDD